MQATGDFDPDAVAGGYSIDSRTLQPGELFFAVRGERLDGHDFVEAALAKGAVGAVVAQGSAARAFRNEAGCWRSMIRCSPCSIWARPSAELWGKPLIGVTGSAGKTTTKEAIAHVLATRHRVLKSQGNLNNQFGMPLQLLKLEPEHDIAVIEMGMSHAGEITALARLAQPNCGVVTMVAPVHLEFFDSIAAIARAKYELIKSLPAGGIAVLNADDEYVSQFGRDFPRQGRDLRIAQACRCLRAEHRIARAARARHSTYSLTASERAQLCRCWASTASTTRSRRLPSACSTEFRCSDGCRIAGHVIGR